MGGSGHAAVLSRLEKLPMALRLARKPAVVPITDLSAAASLAWDKCKVHHTRSRAQCWAA